MDKQSLYLLGADLLLGSHVLIVIFIVGGQLLILVGGFAYWQWVRNPWYRAAHLAAMAVVVVQSWAGRICPLTTWEMALRSQAGDAVYSGSFVAYWLSRLLYHEAPVWVFAAAYSGFGVLVAASWFWVRPRPFCKGADRGAG